MPMWADKPGLFHRWSRRRGWHAVQAVASAAAAAEKAAHPGAKAVAQAVARTVAPQEYAMPPAAALSLLARLTRQRRRAHRLPEPADMGTAFGMEQWLDERDRGGRPATAPAPSAKRSWLSRWLQSHPTP